MLSLLLSAVLAVTTCVITPSTVNVAEADSSELANPRVVMNECDTVYFGRYLQEDTNGDGTVDEDDEKQPIRWRILWQNADGTDAYVVADQVLDCQPYNTEYTDVTWENCSLRQWLNNDFYKMAFKEEEQKAIIEQTLMNEDNELYGTSGGSSTTDRVYLLSLSDMKNPAYIVEATQYAKEQGLSIDEERGILWWLRSPGSRLNDASYVYSSGYVEPYGFPVDSCVYVEALGHYVRDFYGVGVRPALHLNLLSPFVTEGEKMEVTLKSSEWDTVELGTYDGKPITWRVLSVSGQDVFLLSDQILTFRRYNNTLKSSTWDNSELRNWLNTEFYEGAFTDDERKGIVEKDYANADNPWYGTDGGEDTKDYVSLLSLEDILKQEYGFPTVDWCGHPSRIACGKEGYDEVGYGSRWWVRAPGGDTFLASYVCIDGAVDPGGDIVASKDEGVRPVLHLNPSVYPLTKKGTVKAEAGVKLSNPDTLGEPTDNTEAPTEKPADKTEASTEKPADKTEATTEIPTVTTEATAKENDKPTTFNIKDKKTCKQSKKVTVKDSDGIKQIKLNKKTIKVGGKKSYSFKLSKYKKYLKKKGKWNKLVVTDKNGKNKSIQFKTK